MEDSSQDGWEQNSDGDVNDPCCEPRYHQAKSNWSVFLTEQGTYRNMFSLLFWKIRLNLVFNVLQTKGRLVVELAHLVDQFMSLHCFLLGPEKGQCLPSDTKVGQQCK